MKIMIAGGTGFIGQVLTRMFLEHGYTISILSRDPIRHRVQTPDVEILQWDGISTGTWRAELNTCDAIINLAGISIGSSRWSSRFKEQLLASRVKSTATLVTAVAGSDNKPKVLINASAVGFYGHVAEGEVNEASPPGNDFLAQTCRQWEREAMKGEALGMRVVLMRTGFVIGRSAPAFKKMVLPYRFFIGGILGDGRQWFPWIHIDDVGSAYKFVLENEQIRGAVNVTAPESSRSAEFALTLGKMLGRPAWMRVPAWSLRIVLGEMSDLLLKGQKAVPAKLLESGFSFRYPRVDAALREIFRKDERTI